MILPMRTDTSSSLRGTPHRCPTLITSSMRRLVISTASGCESQDWVSTPVRVVYEVHVSMWNTAAESSAVWRHRMRPTTMQAVYTRPRVETYCKFCQHTTAGRGGVLQLTNRIPGNVPNDLLPAFGPAASSQRSARVCLAPAQEKSQDSERGRSLYSRPACA
jgi:hypothetical protein